MILFYIIEIFILLTLGLITTAIVLKWMNKQEKGYIEVNIDEWKKLNIVNMELRKRKEILEREVIKIILDNE